MNVSAQMNGIAMAQQGAVSGDWEMATIETWMHIIHAKDGRKTGSVTIKVRPSVANISLAYHIYPWPLLHPKNG